jgi:hypothetical protein
VTADTASGNTPLAAHVRLIRAAADLIEQAGIPGLTLYPEPGEIVIQVPGTAGDAPSHTASITRLAALTGCEPAPDPRPGRTHGWLNARGTFAGHPVHIFAPLTQEDPAS